MAVWMGASPIVNNGLLVFNRTSPTVIRGFNAVISGTGNVRVQAPLRCKPSGANSYTGWTQIDSGATFQPFIGNEGQLASSVITNNGTLYMEGQEGNPATRGISSNNIVGTGRVLKDNNNQNDGWLVVAGTNNTYTGGTFIAGGGIQLGTESSGQRAPSSATWSSPTRRPRSRTRAGSCSALPRTGSSPTTSPVATDGPTGPGQWHAVAVWPKVTLTGNNSIHGGTTIAAGATLQAGNGGSTGRRWPGNVANDAPHHQPLGRAIRRHEWG